MPSQRTKPEERSAMARGLIPNAPIREAFRRSGERSSVVAMRMGWLDRGRGDGNRLKRVLGINSYWPPHATGQPFYQHSMSWKNALKVLEALGEAPADYGL